MWAAGPFVTEAGVQKVLSPQVNISRCLVYFPESGFTAVQNAETFLRIQSF